MDSVHGQLLHGRKGMAEGREGAHLTAARGGEEETTSATRPRLQSRDFWETVLEPNSKSP